MMEQISLFFKYLMTSNTINFILMILFLCWVFKKANLVVALNKAITKLKDEILNSNNAKENADKEFTVAQKDFDNLPSILKSINTETMAGANMVCANYEASADNAVSLIKKNIPSAIADEERRISSILTNHTLDKTVEVVRNEISSKLTKNNDLQIKFVEQSLKEFEGLNI